MSGSGMLARFRKVAQPLRAQSAFPIWLRNAQRGFRPMSAADRHYTMDICSMDSRAPISASRQPAAGAIGALALSVGCSQASRLAAREDFPPEQFERLLSLAESAGRPVEAFLLDIAKKNNFDTQAYRGALEALAGEKLPPYIFWPIPFDEGQVGILAGDMNTELWPMNEAARKTLDIEAQLVYFSECLMAGLHGIGIGDLICQGNATPGPREPEIRDLFIRTYNGMCAGEADLFLEATSLSINEYQALFTPQRAICWT